MPISGNGGTRTALRVDPFATFKFGVEVDGIFEAQFTECSGLEIANEIFEYQEGGLNEYSHKFPGRTKLSNITLKRGFATSNELFDWYSRMRDGLLADSVVPNRKVTITLYSTAKQDELMRWTLNEAFPVKWVGPAFKTGGAEVAIETLEFAHHGIIVDE